jgi:hypothetical protein
VRGPDGIARRSGRVPAQVARGAPAAALAIAFTLTLALLTSAPPARAQQPEAFAPPAALEWRAVFKLINATAHGEPGDLGYVAPGDDTRESSEQSLRLQLTGTPLFWLDYRFDYRNVKQNLGFPVTGQATGAELFRRVPLRWYFEGPGGGASTQTVYWFQEIDDAFVRIAGGPVEVTLGRQPITWGAGRIWQPTDVFAAFAPTALDTEYKPGIDGVLLSAYPFSFASLQLAYIFSPHDKPGVPDSTALRWRGQVGQSSEATLVLGRIRGESLAGGSLETSWLEAGWRVEGVAFHPRDEGGTAVFAVAGVDHQLGSGWIVLAEWYHHSLGAATEADLPAVVTSRVYTEGRLLQLSRNVLALSASRDFLGLWKGSYALFASALPDAAGTRHASLLHQLTFTYSISDNAEAVFSVLAGTGRGLDLSIVPHSEFGQTPNVFTVSLQFVL